MDSRRFSRRVQALDPGGNRGGPNERTQHGSYRIDQGNNQEQGQNENAFDSFSTGMRN